MMTKSRLVVLLSGLSVLMTGCLYSFQPFYRAEDLFFDPGLAGQWQAAPPEEENLWSFEPADNNAYTVVFRMEGKSSRVFIGRLARVGEGAYLDLYPKEKEGEDFDEDLVAPYHLLYKFQRNADILHLEPLDYDWGEKVIKDGSILLSYVDLQGTKVLTSPTDVNRQLLLDHAGSAFTGKYILKLSRVPAAGATAE